MQKHETHIAPKNKTRLQAAWVLNEHLPPLTEELQNALADSFPILFFCHIVGNVNVATQGGVGWQV